MRLPLQNSFELGGEITKDALISSCGKYRYTLSRGWGFGKGTICWVMLNPSTADHHKDDPTIKRITKWSQDWGYQKLIVVNIFPYRSSIPADCKQWVDCFEKGQDWYVRDAILCHNWPKVIDAAKKSDRVMVAWGAGDWFQHWAENLAMEIQEDVAPYPDLYCIGTNTNGTPKHPMARGKHRVPDNQKPILWKAS